MDSGQEQRISRWDQARRQYDAQYGVKSHDDLSTLMTFYLAREGSLHGFRFKDFQDFTTASNHRDTPSDTDQTLGTGDGSDQTFQLSKTYTSGVGSNVRNITKPVSGTVVVSLNDISVLTGWTVDTTTGIITFTSAPSAGVVVKAGCEFDVPVRFTGNAGVALSVNYESFGHGGTAVELLEIMDEGAVVDNFYFGGAYETTLTTADTHNLLLSDGRVQVFECTNSAAKVKLPDFTNLPLGGPYAYIENPSTSTQSFGIVDQADTALMTVTAGKVVEVCLTENASSVKEWLLF